jgi:glycosyltransferase involved in cell wall biosynthesis
MKKVLVITYYWPPAGGAGVQRWLKFVKYMRSFGWEPIVYTVANGEIPVEDHSLLKDVPPNLNVIKRPIWEPYHIYKRFIGRSKEDKINASFLTENKRPGLAEKISVWIRGNFFIPDARRFWIRPSIKYLRELIEKENISHVISSGPPHSMHLIARGLKRKRPSLKWLADFRDPWTNIDFYDKLMLSRRADRLHHRLELSVLNEADLVLSIGHAMNEEFIGICKSNGGKNIDKFKVITNGFDEEDLAKGTVTRDEKFSIAHIGTLVKDRNPEVLWKVLSGLVSKNKEFAAKLEIKLVGKVDLFVKEEIERHGLSSFVRKIEYLPHSEVIIEQQRSAVLLLLVNNTPNAKGILTGKFFEYMASGRPVLAIGPEDGDLAAIMSETGCGLISNFDDAVTLEKNVMSCFNGQTMPVNGIAVALYSRRALTERLCRMLAAM